MNGIETIRALRKEGIPSKVLILTSSEERDDLSEAMEAGANGYLLKNIGKDGLILAIRSIYSGMDVFDKNIHNLGQTRLKTQVKGDGGTQISVNGVTVDLSEREMQIIKMIVEGNTFSEMSKDLYIAEGRVRNIVTEIIGKLMLKDKTQLAVFAIKSKLIDLK